MLIKCLPVGHLMTNCYIVTDETTLECAVIDPGDESNTILYYLEDNHLTCRAILLTHGHYDHTGAVYAVHEETGAPVYMNALDAGTAVAFDSYTFTPPEGTIFYKEGDEVRVGNLTFRVMETPGHTPGGVTLICGDALFTGDTAGDAQQAVVLLLAAYLLLKLVFTESGRIPVDDPRTHLGADDDPRGHVPRLLRRRSGLVKAAGWLKTAALAVLAADAAAAAVAAPAGGSQHRSPCC